MCFTLPQVYSSVHCILLCASMISDLTPKVKATACGIATAIASKDSFTAFGDPGRLMINVLFRIPQTSLKKERSARLIQGVIGNIAF